MGNYNTKYFGEILLDEKSNNEIHSYGRAELKYDGQEIYVTFFGRGIFYGNKLKECLEILDKYIEINEISKKTIGKFSRKILKELNYPNIHFLITNDEINFSLEYITTTFKKKAESFQKAYVKASEEGILMDFPPSPLSVKMDAKFNILDISGDGMSMLRLPKKYKRYFF